MKSLSHVWLFATPWTAASRAPRSMGFSKQEYWSGLPFPSPQSFLLERKCYCFRHLIETQTKCLSPTHSSKPGLNTISSAGTSGVPPIRISPPKGDVSWVFTGRTDVEAETPILWPPDAKSWLIGKDPDAGKDWGQEEKGMTEDEMVGWRHRLNGHGFAWTPGVGDGHEGLTCCGSWSHKESDTTERLNWIELLTAFTISQHLLLTLPLLWMCLPPTSLSRWN